MANDEAGSSAWEEFDVTSAVTRHVIQMGGGGKAVGQLRLRVKVNGAGDRSRLRLTFGDDWCDDVHVRELRHRHHPVLNVLTRDRSVYCSVMLLLYDPRTSREILSCTLLIAIENYCYKTLSRCCRSEYASS